MTREEEENETGGVAGYAMVLMKESCIRMHHFFAVSLGDSMGGTSFCANPLVQTVPRGEKHGLHERICTKASAA